MPGRAFFDTNILIYALAKGDPRSVRAEELLAAGGVLSIQILNEFVSVARRKIQMSWSEVAEALGAIRVLCSSPLPLTVDTHETALKIAEKHGYGIYDALAVARRLKLIARRSTPTFRMARQSMAKSRSEIRLLLDLLRNPHRLRSLAKSGFTHYVLDDHVAFDPKATGLPTGHRDTGADIMRAGSPYAHVHVMGRPDGNQSSSCERRSRRHRHSSH